MISNQANTLDISAEPHSIIINHFECNTGKQQEKHNIKSLPSQDTCDSLKSNSDSCSSLRNIKGGSFRKINLTSISSSLSTSSFRSGGDQADIDDDDFSCSSPVCINQSDNDEAVYNDDISFCSSSRSCIMTGKKTASKESPTLISNREESIKIDQSSLRISINSISNDIIDDRTDDRDINPKDAAAGGYRFCDEPSVSAKVCRDLRNLKDIPTSHCYNSSSKCSSSSSTPNSHNSNLSEDQDRTSTASRVSQDELCTHCCKCSRRAKLNLNKDENEGERTPSCRCCCGSSDSLYSCNCSKCCCCCSDCDNLRHCGVAPASFSSVSSQQRQQSKSGGLHRHRPCRRHRQFHKQGDNVKSIL